MYQYYEMQYAPVDKTNRFHSCLPLHAPRIVCACGQFDVYYKQCSIE